MGASCALKVFHPDADAWQPDSTTRSITTLVDYHIYLLLTELDYWDRNSSRSESKAETLVPSACADFSAAHKLNS